ncbi:hypothetical protein BJX62DRAFT_240544 [Aspergillus germanicus]
MMKNVFTVSIILALNVVLALGQGLFPFLWCTSTTTLSLSGAYTLTATSTMGSATRPVTVTALPTVGFHLSLQTSSNFSLCGLSTSRSSSKPSPLRAILLHLLVASAAPRHFFQGEPVSSHSKSARLSQQIANRPATIIPPTITRQPCTKLTGSFEIVTDTTTVTTSGVATTTVTPSRVITVTETWIQPTPTSYDGVNYYQYINDYYYPDGTGGCANCGYGGGGYDTADWNGNTSYYTSGLTRDINFQSQKLPRLWTVVFQGFLHARNSGTYTIAPALGTDNALFFWGGEKAYRQYANGNVDGGVRYTQPAGLPHSFDCELVAGEFYPITFIFANGFGPLLNRVDISGPNGTGFSGGVGLFVPPCPDSPFVP